MSWLAVQVEALGAVLCETSLPLALKTERIVLEAGDLRKVRDVVSISPEVPKGAFARKARP